VSWLSLDNGDNDAARFLSYLVAAIQVHYPQIGQELLAALQSPQPPLAEMAIRILINQIATLPSPLIVVLDDYHVIENGDIHTGMSFLLEHSPANLTLVLLTRTDPPLPLARLRARHEMLELRADALRFTYQEVEQFLNQTMRLNLPPELIGKLDSRTEGWIAGLQLAGLALQTASDDPATFVQNFSGSNRFVLDYLLEEVLARQPEIIRRFLLQTSILGRLNGGLCSVVAGEANGQAMLEHLERDNLFVIPLDQARQWYRYHHLFADLLHARLLAEYPDTIRELYERAAAWHEQNNSPEEAIHYALEAQDFDHAARLIVGAGAGVSQRGEVTTLLNWYRLFPPDFVRDHPRLSLYFGVAFALNGRWVEAETLLRAVEEHENAENRDEALLLAYLVAGYRQDIAHLEAIIEDARENPQPKAVTKLVMGLAVGLKGDWRDACRLIAEAQEMAEGMEMHH
jgi:LuxR family transcriptional regulator, maltose regulon positive regulatory protein